MVFNSLQFYLFFPIVTAIFFLLPQRARVVFLLLASCVFYMAFKPLYILILFFTIFVDYWAGILIERSSGASRRLWLFASIGANVSVLAVFKYYNFAADNLSALGRVFQAHWPIPHLGWILPIGLSFHTFQAMSYTAEIYKGRQKAEKNPLVFALYVLFYPQLVAGPIERPQNLLHQFREEHVFDYERVTDGLKLMAWGLFKKAVIADRLRLWVDQIYGAPRSYSGPALLTATVFFAYQIYCDFSGYSDIAIGAAQVMGFKLMTNFRRPYFSRSVSEFWSRWHISLSTWFKDYVYIPLGGNRVGRGRWLFNLFVTFLISGLWHGANWTYIIWGALNGFYIVCSVLTQGTRDRLSSAAGLDRFPVLRDRLRIASTFSLICVSWVFFRARNVQDAWFVLTHLLSGWGALAAPSAAGAFVKAMIIALGGSKLRLPAVLGAIAALEGLQAYQEAGNSVRGGLAQRSVMFRWGSYYALCMAILLLSSYAPTQFIYFQF